MDEIKNVILISIDDLRSDCLSIEKDKRWLEKYNADTFVKTPTLDGIANKGVRFTNCISTSSYTPGSHASMLTGLYLKNHKVKTFFDPLPNNVLTLGDVFSAQGWKTHAWTEHLTLQMQRVTKGIDDVVEPFREDANLFEFIKNLSPENRNFLFIHCFDVHKPYFYTTGGNERLNYNDDLDEMINVIEKMDMDPTELLSNAENEAKKTVNNFDKLNSALQEYAIYRSLDYLLRKKLTENNLLFEELIPLYVKGVNKFDNGKFKDMIEAMKGNGLMDDSLLILTADHGETRCSWNDRDDFMNSFNTSEGALRVPLIFYSELIPKGLEINEQVSLIDIMPTVLDLVGLKINKKSDGLSLRSLIERSETSSIFDRFIFSESWAYQGGSTFFGTADDHAEGDFLAEASARKDGLKFIWRNNQVGENGFYNIQEDPFEENDIMGDERSTQYKNELQKYLMDYHLQKVTKNLIGKMQVKKG